MNSKARYHSARWITTAAVTGVLSFATLNMVGCDDNDTPGEVLDEAIDETGDAVEEVGEDIEDAADDVGDEIDDAADDAKS
ncbi:MAG: hypothetical protein H6812_10080 [Phycisphaeraceae bacterium]|nr:hypothetical protein [Phycisphaerales bacterium]MCB9843593.1 hypothetical protein [Phycisphaeraceae bacterium]